MKTQYYTASTLNGFLADENDSLEWLMQFGEIESMKDHYPNFIAQVGALVMGAKTYEWVYNHENLKEHPEKWFYSLPTWVMTHRNLPVVAGADIRFTSDPVSEVHAEMARHCGGDKNIWPKANHYYLAIERILPSSYCALRPLAMFLRRSRMP